MNDSVESVRAADAMAIERTLAGERDAFRVLVERHSGTIFRLAYRLTGNHHDAEEIVQEAFLRAYQKLGQFAAEANFATWVYRIAANYTIDRKRQMKTEETRRVTPSPEKTDEGGDGSAAARRRRGTYSGTVDSKRGATTRHEKCSGQPDAGGTSGVCDAPSGRLRD